MSDSVCSNCDGTNISGNSICQDCGCIVCIACGNDDLDKWVEPYIDEWGWVSFCEVCGAELRADEKPFRTPEDFEETLILDEEDSNEDTDDERSEQEKRSAFA